MKDIIKMGAVLMIICLCAGLALGSVYQVAWPKIEEQRRLARERALKEVMPEAQSQREVTNALGETYYEGLVDNVVVCYAKETSVKGYGGAIELMVGITNDDAVCGVKVLSHTETPGLGAKIGEIKYGDEKPWFLEQFYLKALAGLQVVKHPSEEQIEAITGATISSEAVTSGVKQILQEIIKLEETK